ncbi:HNH endonuclease [Nocardia nova]|uniref:HNH endonuclease n=1 Tax=Nocardia nova TaxID=37330 RepID=UPI0034E84F69
MRLAHDVAWEVHHGRPLPDGMLIRHSCDNPLCVNPSHLLLGTHSDNMQDKVDRDRCGYNGTGFRHLTPDEVRRIRQLHEQGVNMTEISRRFGRSRTTIGRVVRRESFVDVM